MYSRDDDAVNTSEEVWDLTMQINLKGVYMGCKYGTPALRRSGGGSIINTASFVALLGAATPQLAYTASKGALHTLTRDMAIKLAPHGIRVNTIAPGAFDTDMLAYIRSDPERDRAFLARMPPGRVGQEDDAKGAVVYLASAASAFVTGQILVVDGGWSVQTA